MIPILTNYPPHRALFTVSVSIDHIICNVLRQPQVMESVVSLSTEFYLLKLHGRVEYLDSDSLLKVCCDTIGVLFPYSFNEALRDNLAETFNECQGRS